MQLTNNKVYLITGVAGFIGSFLSKWLLNEGCKVIGVDNINDYYDTNLKYRRLDGLMCFNNFVFIKNDISNKEFVIDLFSECKPDIVINLAAQAGVQYSAINPNAYIVNNIIGFYNILEACKLFPVEHLIFASSSSVYGANKKVPFEETDFVDKPVSLYAATKKSNELMAYSYSHLYKIPTTGLRFFTVYGPMGRPDMAYFDFCNKYFTGKPIKVYNNGDIEHDLFRDFTYIDDIVEGIVRTICNPPTYNEDQMRYNIYNIGNSKPIRLMTLIETLEKALGNVLGREVIFNKVFEAVRPGDVLKTFASTKLLQENVGYKPSTPIEIGLKNFAEWYVEYYHIK